MGFPRLQLGLAQDPIMGTVVPGFLARSQTFEWPKVLLEQFWIDAK